MPQQFSWNLDPDAASSSSSSSATTIAASAEASNLAFLGAGILTPFRRDEKNDFANGSGRVLLRSRIRQILMTKADSTFAPGELPWRTDFGSRLHVLRHRNNSEILAEFAREMIIEALERWERFVDVLEVEHLAQPSIPKNKLVLRLHYRIVDASGTPLDEPDSVDLFV